MNRKEEPMILIVYNPVSGLENDDLPNIEKLLKGKNAPYELLITESSDTIRDFFRGKSEEYDCILIAGGDGTISQVIEAVLLNDLKAKLLVYPKGTTNEYASSLEVTKQTMEKYLDGNTDVISVDIGQYGEEVFFTYSFVFGNFSHIPCETPQWIKNRLGYAGYWLYGFITLYVFRLKRYVMTFNYNDITITDIFLFGSISNSETLGKVIHLNDVSFSDGLMELFLVKAPRSLLDVIRFLSDTRTGENTSGLLIHEKIESVNISSPNKHAWSADGEYSGEYDNLEVFVRKKSVKLIVNKEQFYEKF